MLHTVCTKSLIFHEQVIGIKTLFLWSLWLGSENRIEKNCLPRVEVELYGIIYTHC